MCFTPLVSMSTAVIEFTLGLIILFKFRRTVISVFSSMIIFFLGLYQFTEFMLCTSNNPASWATLGFMTYTCLPAIWLYSAYQLHKPKFNTYLLFIPTVFFVSLPLFFDNFILESACHSVYVTVNNVLYQSHTFLFYLYTTYYFGYVFYGTFIVWGVSRKEKNPLKQKIYSAGLIITLAALLPPVVLLVILPAHSLAFPSIYCHFAILYAIGAFVLAAIDEKYKLSEPLEIKNMFRRKKKAL